MPFGSPFTDKFLQIMIRSIFLYMDRTYLMQTSGLKSLWDTGLDLFRGAIMDDAGIQRSVVHQLLHLILQDRYVSDAFCAFMHVLKRDLEKENKSRNRYSAL